MERKWISFRLGVPHVRYLHRSAWSSCIISYICLALRICDCTRCYHFIPALYIVQKYMQLLYGLFLCTRVACESKVIWLGWIDTRHILSSLSQSLSQPFVYTVLWSSSKSCVMSRTKSLRVITFLLKTPFPMANQCQWLFLGRAQCRLPRG